MHMHEMAAEGFEGKYDAAFMSVLQDVGQIQPFLDAVFSFLGRRTDFYLALSDDGKFGFAPGVAENVVKKAFTKHQKVAQTFKPTEVGPAVARAPESQGGRQEDNAAEQLVKERQRSAVKEARVVAETYNGAEEDGYRWAQTATDIEMTFPVPAGTVGRDIQVDIRPDHLKVALQGPEGPRVLVDRPLAHAVRADESMWHVDKSSNTVVVSLEKGQDFMWKSVLKGGTEVDVQSLDTRRDISEFDSDAQAAIQRAQYDHHMKMLGQPTSQEQKAHDILRKAWDAEGSPFKGTPFDPSQINISGNFPDK